MVTHGNYHAFSYLEYQYYFLLLFVVSDEESFVVIWNGINVCCCCCFVEVVVTGEEGHVVTCGRDGSVVVWRLAELDDKSPGFLAARERLQDLPSVPEMLVSRSDLEVKLAVKI